MASIETGQDGYVSYPLAYIIVGSMMLTVSTALILFSVFLSIVRRRAKKEQQLEFRAYREMVEKIKIENAQKHQAIPSSSYVITPQQKLLNIQHNKLAGPQPIETRADDLAGIVSYLAENQVDDEDIEFRPAHRNVLLVKQQLVEAVGNKENCKRAADSNV